MTFYIITQNEGRIYDTNIQRLRSVLWNNMIFSCLQSRDFGRVGSIYKEDGKVVQQVFFVIWHEAVYPAYTNCNKKRETYRSYWPIYRFNVPTVFVDKSERPDSKPSKFEDMIHIISLDNRQILCWARG